MANSHKIVDCFGQPIDQNNDDSEGNLPPGVQALIETRVNAAVADIREHNRDDLQDLARDHVRKWRYLTALSMAFGLVWFIITAITMFYAPKHIGKWVSSQVDKKLTEPMLKQSADRVIAAKMSAYVDDRLQPLRDQAASLETSLDTTRKDVATKQTELEQQQVILSKQLKVSELAVAAKAGSRSSYIRLLDMVQKDEEPSDFIRASLKEIEIFFDEDRAQMSFEILVKKATWKDPGFSVDEVVQILRSQPDLADAAINTLSNLKSKKCVSELCSFIEKTDNLRAAARATRALEQITGEKFRPLDFEKVTKWWAENSTNGTYCGSYDGYCAVERQQWYDMIYPWQLEAFVKQLTATCESDPDALHARCLRAGFLLMLGRKEEADLILEEVQKKKPNYRWLLVWKAAEKIISDDSIEAVSLLNQAFSASPDEEIEQTVRRWKLFNPIISNDDIHWPSKKIEDTKSKDSPEKGQAHGTDLGD